jgi:hypothetical protein
MMKWKEDEMGRACSTHEGKGMRIRFSWESRKEGDHYEDLGVVGG